MITYVDTSTLLKLIIDEPGSDHAATIWSAADAVASVSLVVVEARAAIAAAGRNGRLSAAQQRTAVGELGTLVGDLHIVSVTDELIDSAAELAEVEALRGYDAVHLAAALAIGAKVLTSADRALCAAAARQGLHVSHPLDADETNPEDHTSLVMTWLESVFDRGDLEAVWHLVEERFRLALAQSWIWSEQNRSDIQRENPNRLAAELASEHPVHPLWREFADWRVDRWEQVLPSFVTDATIRGFIATPAFVSADLEAVLVADFRDADDATMPPGPALVQRFLVKHTAEGPRLAGIGGDLPQPGWPPTETDRFPT